MHNPRILLVDDEQAICSALMRVLRTDGYEIETAHSGMDALSALARAEFDVVLSDYKMPGMDGAQLLEEVARRHPGTTRLMLSGQADLPRVIEAMNRGDISRYLAKPWTNSVVRSTVREAVRRSRETAREDTLFGLPGRAILLQHMENRAGRPERSWLILAEVRSGNRSIERLAETERLALGQMLSERILETVQPSSPVCHVERNVVGFVVTRESVDSTLFDSVMQFRQPFLLGDPLDNDPLALRARFGTAPLERDLALDAILRNAWDALIARDAAAAAPPQSIARQLVIHPHQAVTLEHDLEQALHHDEFLCAFQPIVDAGTRKVIAAESLIRWQHPLQGLISPLAFIDLAESNGTIVALGEWMLKRAVEACAEAAMSGHDLRLLVKITPRQFVDSDLPALVAGCLAQTPVHPSCLRLEIPHTAIRHHDPVRAALVLAALHQTGIGIVIGDVDIDDAEDGQFRTLPIDGLRIDHQVLRGVPADAGRTAVFNRLVALGRALGGEIIADGVESTQQAAFCRQSGCTAMKGFHFHRPMSLQRLKGLLSGQRRGQDAG